MQRMKISLFFTFIFCAFSCHYIITLELIKSVNLSIIVKKAWKITKANNVTWVKFSKQWQAIRQTHRSFTNSTKIFVLIQRQISPKSQTVKIFRFCEYNGERSLGNCTKADFREWKTNEKATRLHEGLRQNNVRNTNSKSRIIQSMFSYGWKQKTWNQPQNYMD